MVFCLCDDVSEVFIFPSILAKPRDVCQMDVSGLTLNKLTDEDIVFLENVMIDIRSYLNVLNLNPNKKKVLLFPPVNNFRRFLVHQIVEKTFKEEHLTTLSIGTLYTRRTVVFPAALKLMEKNVSALPVIENVVRKTDCSNTVKQSTEITVSSSSAGQKANSSRRQTKKTRKPDMQIYVPRGRRLFQNEKCTKPEKDSCGTKESSIDCVIDLTHQSTKRMCDILPDSPKLARYRTDISNLSKEKMDTNSATTEKLDIVNAEIPVKKLKDDDQLCMKTDEGSLKIDLDTNCNSEVTDSVNLSESKFHERLSETRSYDRKIQNENAENCSLVTRTDDELAQKENIVSETAQCVATNSSVSCDDDSDNKVESTRNENGEICSKENVDQGALREKEPIKDAVINAVVTSSNSVTYSDRNQTDTPPKSEKSKSNGPKNLDECDWEELFDDDGEFVDKSLVEELMKAIGKVSIQKAVQDYRPFQTVEERSSDGECILEIHDFNPDLKTEDLLCIFAPYRDRDRDFQIVWVDDCHALVIFSSPLIADEVLNTKLPFVKTRPLKNAIPKSRMIAQGHVMPPATRPKTCVSLARRLVSGHLGMKIKVTDQQREAEKKLLSDAREQRRLVARQKLDAWEGAPSGSTT